MELYLQISDIAKREGIDFEKLPRAVRNLILKRVRAMLPPNAATGDKGLQLDNTILSMVIGMLDTARTMNPSDRG